MESKDIELQRIVSDADIDSAWGNADFGQPENKRKIIANALLKYASGYLTGITIYHICKDLSLVGNTARLTKKGRLYLYTYFVEQSI
jgi:hypothetical protein